MVNSKSAVAADMHGSQRSAGDLMPGSRVQSRGGSDTRAPPAGTKYVLENEATVGCEVDGRNDFSAIKVR